MFYNSYISKFIDNFLKLLHSNFGIRDLASPEPDTNFDLVAFLEPAARVFDLELRMVFISFWTQLNFFDFDLLLRFASFTLLFRLLVYELAKVHDSGDWRFGVWRHLH